MIVEIAGHVEDQTGNHPPRHISAMTIITGDAESTFNPKNGYQV